MKLGVFYTDNAFPEIINLSLETLAKNVSDDVRIITCVNHHIETNPFEEIIVNNPVRSHYNIIEKILAGLTHCDDYQTVSFLEHDVLYPEGYFDYPEFKNAMYNNTYIGIKMSGFQKKLPCQLPLHQMVMTREFALQHFQDLLGPSKNQSVIVEPRTDERWDSKYPAVHMNHGRNFTSHFNCYSKETTDRDAYWGYYMDILNKIKPT